MQENDVTDNSPVVRIKSALENLEKEIQVMDVRIGILNNNFIQAMHK